MCNQFDCELYFLLDNKEGQAERIGDENREGKEYLLALDLFSNGDLSFLQDQQGYFRELD